MSLLLNRAKMTTVTTGTGTVTLGEAVSPYQTFATAGAVNALVYAYLIEDANGAWEIGQGTYTSSGTTLSRTLTQSSTGSLLNLSGIATVACVARVTDFWVAPLTILQRTTNQSINSSSNTAVSWDTTVVQDDVSAFAAGTPTKVTVPSGYTRMRVTWFSNWTANSTGQRNVTLSKNGINNNVLGAAVKANNETADMRTSRWLTVVAADTYELDVFQDSGGAINFDGGSGVFGHTYIQFEWAP